MGPLGHPIFHCLSDGKRKTNLNQSKEFQGRVLRCRGHASGHTGEEIVVIYDAKDMGTAFEWPNFIEGFLLKSLSLSDS